MVVQVLKSLAPWNLKFISFSINYWSCKCKPCFHGYCSCKVLKLLLKIELAEIICVCLQDMYLHHHSVAKYYHLVCWNLLFILFIIYADWEKRKQRMLCEKYLQLSHRSSIYHFLLHSIGHNLVLCMVQLHSKRHRKYILTVFPGKRVHWVLCTQINLQQNLTFYLPNMYFTPTLLFRIYLTTCQ